MPLIKVIPAQGKRVLDPDRSFQPLPPEGALVRWSVYWQRLIDDGDVIQHVAAESESSQ